MTYSSSQFELRRTKVVSPLPFQLGAPSFSLPANGQLPNLSNSQLLQGKLRLHGELIDALNELAAQSKAGNLFEPTSIKSREMVLEQALVEQNRILDVIQELVSTLESENKLCWETINSKSTLVANLEAKGKQLEKELALRTRQLPPTPVKQDLKIAELKGQLEDKNQCILSLQSRLRNESSGAESALMAKLSSARTKLEVERVRCIELEEEMSQLKDDLSRLKGKVAENDSHFIRKESEILHLKHEMKTLRNFELEQQDLVMAQRRSLAMKDVQLSSLTRALNKEKKVADQLRRIHANSRDSLLSRVADSSANESLDVIYPKHQASLFDQMSGRETCTVELTRITEETELGFSFTKVELPVSSRVPCLIVKAVKESSQAADLLRPGDELVEVNRILCRSTHQSKAIKLLQEGVGQLKIVLARESRLSASKPLGYSTPMMQPRVANSSDRTALWATALSPTAFESFSVESVLAMPEVSKTPEYTTVPELYAVSVTKDSEGGSLNDDQTPVGNSPELVNQRAERSPSLSKSASSVTGSESLMTFSSKEDVSRRKLQDEVMELRDQLDASEHIRVDIESELNSTKEEESRLQKNYQLSKADNYELHQQVSAYEAEMTEIRQHISILQSALVTLEAQVTDEQQKLASMENHNRVISGELVEAKDTASLAIEARDRLKLEAEQSKAELEQREDKERKMESQLQELKMDNARLASDVARMGGEASELSATLNESKKTSEEAITGLQQELKVLQLQLELAKQISGKNTLSSKEEYQHLTTQLKSAKSLLMEAEMKESQQIVEGRYLKQAADLTDSQLKKLEADYQKTKEELGQFKSEAEKRTVEMESLTVKLRGTQTKLEAKQQMVVRLQGEVDNSRRATSKLRNENSELKERVKKLEIDLNASYLEEERLEGKLEASIAEKDEMFLQLEKSYEDSTELTLSLEALSAQVQELKEQESSRGAKEGEMDKSSENKLQLELDISQKKAELLSEQMSKMRSEMRLVESKCESDAKELTQLKTENKQLNAAKDGTHQRLVQLEGDHSQLKEEMEKRRLMEEDLQATLTQTQEQADIERQHLDEAKHKIVELSSELKAAKEGKKRSEDMVASLEFIQSQDQTKLQQIKQSIDSKEKEIRELNEQVEKVNSLLQKSKLELTSLTSTNASLEQQLEIGRLDQAEEVRDLKDKLSAGGKKLARLNDELKAQETMSEMLQSKVEHMGNLVEQLSQDKRWMETTIEENKKERDDLLTQNKQLQNRVAHFKVELDRLTLSTNSLSSETAGLRQQVRQNEKEIDQATAELNAAEMNLDIATRALEESKGLNLSQSEELENLEAQYKTSQSNLDDLKTTLEGKLMDFFKLEEEFSNVKTALELRQTECQSLQESLINLQGSAEGFKKSVKDSEEAKNRLVSNISQLDEDKTRLQNSLEKIEIEKERMLAQRSSETEGHQKEIEHLQVAKRALMDKNSQLKISLQEAKDSVNQLLSAQEEMKKSVSKLGDEKDADIINLQEKMNKATADLNSSSKSETSLRGEVEKLKQTNGELQEQLECEWRKVSELKDEVELLTTTEQDIRDLNSKVTSLSDNLQDKTKKLLDLESIHRAMESELKNLQSENENLLEKALELSDIKVSMVESMEAARKKLQEEVASRTQLLEERDQLLSRLREFEVHNHASHNNIEPKVPSSPTTDKGVDQLLQLVQDKEEHITRMKAYTDNLLLSVMMSAPALLENL